MGCIFGCNSEQAKLAELEDEFSEFLDDTSAYVIEETASEETVEETEPEFVLPEKLYVRSATNLYINPGDIKLGAFVDKGTELKVLGYDTKDADNNVRMYEVSTGANVGFIRSWYVTEKEEDVEDNSYYHELHLARGDSYHGGNAGDLDYFEREKFYDSKTALPDNCRTMYLSGFEQVIGNYEKYLELAKNSGVNAFVVDISDNVVIAYPSDVMKEYSPTGYSQAINTKEQYAACIKAIKDAGYYVIGRITTFHDDYLCKDNHEWAIADENGDRKIVAGGYWPTAFVRDVWEYKLKVVEEAVDWFGFDEIQFDYVRFPDSTRSYEVEGTIDFRNAYGESKAQAIQRFLMYVTDNLHEKGVVVSADVFGETSNTYVAAYGQYWPAISNVVDIISAMPYCDHYASSGDWHPWEHPYETVTTFAEGAMTRQKECPSPARDRTWIQCYDSIKPPKVLYGTENVGLEIQALYDAGMTGGFMTWHGASKLEKYENVMPIFDKKP